MFDDSRLIDLDLTAVLMDDKNLCAVFCLTHGVVGTFRVVHNQECGIRRLLDACQRRIFLEEQVRNRIFIWLPLLLSVDRQRFTRPIGLLQVVRRHHWLWDTSLGAIGTNDDVFVNHQMILALRLFCYWLLLLSLNSLLLSFFLFSYGFIDFTFEIINRLVLIVHQGLRIIALFEIVLAFILV